MGDRLGIPRVVGFHFCPCRTSLPYGQKQIVNCTSDVPFIQPTLRMIKLMLRLFSLQK